MSGSSARDDLLSRLGPELRRTRPWWIWLLATTAAAVCLTTQPLFNVLSYEFSLAMASIVSFAGAHLGVRMVQLLRAENKSFDPSSPCSGLIRTYLHALGPVLLIAVSGLPVVFASTATGPPCSFLPGLAFYLLLPVVSAFPAVAVGVFSGLLFRRSLHASLLSFSILLGSIVWGVMRFYGAPPVNAYDPFIGYWTGNLYDSLVRVEPPLLWARLFHLVFTSSILAFCAWLFDPKEIALKLRHYRRKRAGAAAAGFVLASMILFLCSGRLGFSMSLKDITTALDGKAVSPNFVLHYPKRTTTRQEALNLLMDAEFRHDQLRRFFGVAVEGRIRILLFGGAMQKRALLGATQVEMAKPWRKEIYITDQGFPHSVLKHEMAHVFGAAFGDRVFGVSFRLNFYKGFLPIPTFNPGLIEGAAVAADWPKRTLTPHQSSRAMLEAGIAPEMKDVMGYSFFGSAAVRSYSMAGSFCRFLVDKYGAARFRKLYRSGGDFMGVYGKSLAELTKAWKSFVLSFPLTRTEKEIALKRLKRRSVFQMVCIHDIARLELEAARAPHREAARIYRRISCMDPADPDHLFNELYSHSEALDLRKAWRTADLLWAHPGLSQVLKVQALRALGNLEWRKNRSQRARILFRKALGLASGEFLKRDLAIRLSGLDDPAVGEALHSFFFPGSKWLDLRPLRRLLLLRPDWAVGHYLIGSVMLSRNRYQESIEAFLKALDGKLPDELIRMEAVRRAGKALYLQGEYDRAASFFSLLTRPGYRHTTVLEAQDWVERCRWAAKNAVRLKSRIEIR